MRFNFRLALWTTRIALIGGVSMSCLASAEMPALNILSNFPSLAAGEKRMLIFAPPSSSGAETYIKISIGKTVAKNCHLDEFIADLIPSSDWGKVSFRLAVTPSLTTLLCPASTGLESFVSIPRQPDSFINLEHSSEPLVIDIPVMLELRYRRWDTCVENNKPILGTMCPGDEKSAEEAIQDGSGWRLVSPSHSLDDSLTPPWAQ